ncbi:amino acid adenylation domain-containing protein [Micromonospora zamorensis]|uniref:amino acid adenylation domain-containing protein n=1 Tax=Micromonospora zamorensis TaxID=709883 RepID=UPI0033F53B37
MSAASPAAAAWAARHDAGEAEVLLAGGIAAVVRHTGRNEVLVESAGSVRRVGTAGDPTLPQALTRLRTADRTDRTADLVVRAGRLVPGGHLGIDPEVLREHAAVLLGAVVAGADDTPVSRLPLLTDAELHRMLVQWNDTTAALDHDRCLHDLVAARAAATPGAPAVLGAGGPVSYRDVDRAANRLAHHLRQLGVGRGMRVALTLGRGPQLLTAVLAVLKAGAAYVPLDVDYPAERLAFMVSDADCTVVVTESAALPRLPDTGIPAVVVDRDAAAITAHPDEAPSGGVTADDPCYVIYTSGSTGRPKGIVLRHRGVVNNLLDLNTRLDIGPGDRVLALSSASFDMSVYELLGSTVAGGSVVFCEPGAARDPYRWYEAIRSFGVTVWNSAPALLDLFVGYLTERRAEPLPLRVAMLGGDWVAPSLPDRLRAFAPAVRVIVMGGATEASIHSILHEAGAPEPGWTSIPYGRPMANQRTYILDEGGQPVPVGVTGELHLAGVGLAAGYLNRPQLTAEKFYRWSYGPVSGERVYRTGDLARYRPDGRIELLGRIDFQVKVRGLRVELGEIEHVLRQAPGVTEAAVVAHRDGSGEPHLVAYLTGDAVPSATVLRDAVAERLPDFMVPEAFVTVPRLPLSPNGKVDRAALAGRPLPDVTPAVTPAAAGAAPAGEVEEGLAEIWRELLGRTHVARTDRFTDIGGNSLKTMQLVARVRGRWGIDVALREVLEANTLSELAQLVRRNRGPVGAGQPRRDPVERLPLTSAQHRLWFMHQLDPDGALYNVPTVLDLDGPLNTQALAAAWQQLAARHDALRTRFPEHGGVPWQCVQDGVTVPLREVDLTAEPDPSAAADRITAADATAPFELAAAVPMRATLLRVAPDRHRLMLTFHHILVDGWSLEVLHRELGALYSALVTGEPAALPPVPLQYPEYTLWHRDLLACPAAAAMTDYWRRTLGTDPVPLELPYDRPRPRRRRFSGAVTRSIVDDVVVRQVHELSRRLRATPYMTYLAAFAAVLSAWSGQTTVTVGTPMAGRTRPEQAGLVGCTINMVPLKTDLSGTPSFRDLVRRVRGATLDAFDNQDLPFDRMVEALVTRRSRDYMPLFRVMFSYLEIGPVPRYVGTDGCRFELGTPDGIAKFDLTLYLEELPSGLRASVEYDQDLFDAATAERLLTRYTATLARAVHHSDEPIDSEDAHVDC